MNTNKKRRWIIAAILLIIAAAAVWYFYSQRGFRFDDAAQDGNLDGMTEKEIEEMMDQKVDESMLSISINTSPEFQDGSSKGSLRIENSAENRYNMTVSIKLDDSGEEIYKSDGIKPGQMIEKDKLDKVLTKGSYPCTATFSAYDTKTNDKVGEAAAKITIQVAQ